MSHQDEVSNRLRKALAGVEESMCLNALLDTFVALSICYSCSVEDACASFEELIPEMKKAVAANWKYKKFLQEQLLQKLAS